MNSNLGLNIKEFRKKKGYTQEELAGMIGVTPQAVSRWESETGLPDVTMIVPIAQALNITTDVLLGNNSESLDDNIAAEIREKLYEMNDISWPAGTALKKTEYLATEVNKNPMNFEVGIMYVQQVAGLSYYIDCEGLLSDDTQKAEAILEDGIKKGVNIIRYSNNQTHIDKAHYALAWIYIHKKDFDNAMEHINVLPSLKNNRIQENILPELVFFEQGFEAMKDSLTANNKLLYSVIGSHLHTVSENYAYWGSKEEALKNIEWCEAVMRAFSSIPEYIDDSIYAFDKKLNHNKMMVYEKDGDKEKAREICENYLAKIRAEAIYSEEEYASIEKEFREKIYQL